MDLRENRTPKDTNRIPARSGQQERNRWNQRRRRRRRATASGTDRSNYRRRRQPGSPEVQKSRTSSSRGRGSPRPFNARAAALLFRFFGDRHPRKTYHFLLQRRPASLGAPSSQSTPFTVSPHSLLPTPSSGFGDFWYPGLQESPHPLFPGSLSENPEISRLFSSALSPLLVVNRSVANSFLHDHWVAMGRALALLLLLAAMACWVQQAAGQNCNKTAPCAIRTDCCSRFDFCGTSDDHCVTGCQNGPCRTTLSPPSPPSPPPPPRPSVSPTPSKGAGTIITRKLFEALYPNYNKTFYSYDAFIVAARAFPKFLNEGCKEVRLRELAAFSAHVQQETAGLVYVEEIDQSNTYCDPTATLYPCEPNQKYFGRGPLQLSWNFNYGPCAKAIGVDILKRPFLVSLDPVVAFKASLWFWNTPREGGIPSIHNVIIGKHKLTAADKTANRKNGFGYTINIINGGIECGKGTATPQAANRVTYFLQFCKTLGVSPGENLDCTNQKSFA